LQHDLVVRVDCGIIADPLLLLLGSLATVLPEHVSSWIEQLFNVLNRDEFPSDLDLIIVPEEHVNERCGETGIGRDEIGNVRACEPGDALSVDSCVIDDEVRVEDGCDVVWNEVGSVGRAVKELLGEEGKIERSPDIAIVQPHVQNDTAKVADATVDQGLQRQRERRSKTSDVVPIKGQGQEAKTLITLGTTKKIGEDQTVLIGEAKD